MNVLFKKNGQYQLCFDKRGASLSFNPLGSTDSLSSTRDYICVEYNLTLGRCMVDIVRLNGDPFSYRRTNIR